MPGRSRRTLRPLLALLALALLARPARADEQRGLQLVRDAQAALAAGDAEQGVELLRQARIEWPGSPLVAATLADALRELGRYDESISESERVTAEGELRRHALFNRAVTRHLKAEEQLEQAAVPADVGALPEGPQPEMLQAIEQATGQLAKASGEFLQTLSAAPEDPARESLEALGRRSEALSAIAEELRRRQEEQNQKDPQDQNQEQQQQEQQEQQQQDQRDKDQQPQPQPQDQEQDQQAQPDQPQDQQPPDQPQDQSEPDASDPQPQGEPRELSPEEVQRLLDRLDDLEKQGRELQKAREAARRKPVERDW